MHAFIYIYIEEQVRVVVFERGAVGGARDKQNISWHRTLMAASSPVDASTDLG